MMYLAKGVIMAPPATLQHRAVSKLDRLRVEIATEKLRQAGFFPVQFVPYPTGEPRCPVFWVVKAGDCRASGGNIDRLAAELQEMAIKAPDLVWAK